MRAVVQRVESATVAVAGVRKGRISRGLVVFLGVAAGDTHEDTAWLARKISSARVFPDDAGLMNLSVCDIDGEVMLISQFTLFGNMGRGTRPSFNRAAPPGEAAALYEACAVLLERATKKRVRTGVFGAPMRIEAVNDGPVTLIIDTRDRKF